MDVLLLADDCNPDWPSLPVVGFKAARALADEVDLTVATHIRNRSAIERDGLGRAAVEYIDNEYIARPAHWLGKVLRGGTAVGWTTNVALGYLPYLAFEREVWKVFRHELEAGMFDVVHRLTPMSPTLPSFLAKRSPVPFVLGPLNGGLKWPIEFRSVRRREREWLTTVRRMHRWLPYYRSTYRSSAAILTGFKHTQEDVPEFCHRRCIDFPEVGVDPDLFRRRTVPRPRSGPLTILFAGRLVPYKCPDVTVLAFARSAALKRHRLVVVGDGPEMGRLQSLVDRHRLHGCVELRGWTDQAGVAAAMGESDIFAFPSIRELGAGALVEAMASGLACVVVDYGGPGGLVRPGLGVKVPLGNRDELATRFVRELESLVAAPERVRDMGRRAQEFVLTELTWAAKARKTVAAYRWALGEQVGKPEFWAEGGAE